MSYSHKILGLILFFLLSFGILSGQDFGPECKFDSDATIELDRKGWTVISGLSQGSFLNFDLPSNTFGDCMKITEITIEVTINNIDDGGVPADCFQNNYYLNMYIGQTLPLTPAGVNTSLEVGSPNNPDWNVLSGVYTYDCTNVDIPWGGQVGADIVPVGNNNNCPDWQNILVDYFTLDYEICVYGNVGVVGNAEINAISNGPDLCLGENLELAENGIGNVDWVWDGPNGSVGTISNPIVPLLDASDFGDYIVTVTDGDGCTNSQTITIDQLPIPTADATVDDNTVCVGQDILLDEQGGDALDWSWTYPNGGTSIDQDPIIANSNSTSLGTYTVTITDGNGCTAESTVNVDVAPDVPIDVTAVSTNFCPGQDIFLEENGGSGGTFDWTGPDGFTSTDEDPIITAAPAAADGIYTVIVTDGSGCTNSGTVTITAVSPPAVQADAVSLSLCIGETIELLETGGNGDNYDWSGPNGPVNNVQNPQIPNATINDFGTYTVTVTDSNGCSDTDEVTISQVAAAEVCFDGNGSMCSDDCTSISYTFSINPPSATLDVELDLSNLGLPNYTLTGVTDGQSIGFCSDETIFNVDFDGVNLILPTTGVAESIYFISIASANDQLNPACGATIDPACSAELDYFFPTQFDIEYNGSNLFNGSQITCETGFDPSVSPNQSGSWFLSGDPISLPVDLTTFAAGFYDLEFVPDQTDCTQASLVEIELIACGCDLFDAGLGPIICDDNGTPTDDTDDFILFTVDPQVMNGGLSYSLLVSSGTVSPDNGLNYGGTASIFMQPGSAGGGDVTLTIVDDSDVNCFIEVVISDPGSCSGSCNLTSAIITNELCDDSGTPNDPTDDFITFDIEVFGSNTSTGFMIMSSFGQDAGLYGGPSSSELPQGSAGAGDVILTIVDDGDPNCSIQVTLTDPGSCSGACNVSDVIPIDVLCNNNGTDTDDSDDFISFSLDIQGSNLLGDFTLSGTGIPASTQGGFGALNVFNTSDGTAGQGDITVTLTSINDPSCTYTFMISDPGSCSGACTINDEGITNISCQDGGTDSDDTDDFISFTLNPQALNGSASYVLTTDIGTVTPNTGSFGAPTDFQLQAGSAGAGDVTLTITDEDDTSCSIEVTIPDPGTCSGTCNITSAVISDVTCLDPNTPTDPTDDIIMYFILVEGSNTSTGFTINSPFNDVTGPYGTLMNFTIPAGAAGNGDLTLTIADNVDATCMLQVTLTDPGTCSEACIINSLLEDNITCDDNGTSTDDTDDFITFTLDPQVLGGASEYNISVDNGTVTPNVASYGQETTFQLQDGSAGSGGVIITVSDVNDPNCMIDIPIPDPGTCSSSCEILDLGESNIDCQDNGTPTDDTDDIISFTLDPQVNGGATEYNLSVDNGTVIPNLASYGQESTFELQDGSAGSGDIILTVSDANDPTCLLEITITDPGSCSSTCEILDLGESDISCQDNGTPTDDTDDFISFSLDPMVLNGSAGYIVSVSVGTVTPTNGTYGSASSFQLDEGSAGGGDITVTVVDEDDPNCFLEFLIVDTGSCSGTCNITAADISDVFCDDAGTPSDPTDDFITFSIEVAGSNTSSNFSLTSNLGNESGEIGSLETFSFPAGSAGAGDIDITIADQDDPTCDFQTIVIDPGSCSGACELIDVVVTEIMCNDNGTDDDDTDDVIIFEIEIQGNNLSGDYILEGTGIDATTQQTFGGATEFMTLAGTAGQGDISITLTSLDDADCSLSFDLEDPGSCSAACNDPGDCDDGDCTNGIESWDDQLCECVSTDIPTCDNGTLIEMICDDNNPCTIDDVMFVEECLDEVCIPCAGIPLDCTSEENILEQPCDDLDDNTINDVETILLCDNSVCIPCQGELKVPTIFFPQIFTPDDDGNNDEFKIFSDVEFTIEEFSIYDRWGELMYNRTNVMSTDPSLSWDGRFGSQMLVPGVYVYYIKLGDPFNEVKVGDITLVY